MVNPVRELRQQLKDGLTQREIARRMGVNETYISNFLAGHRAPNEKLLAYLGLRKIVRVSYRRLNGEASDARS